MDDRVPLRGRAMFGAAVVLALVTTFVMWDWLRLDRMPGRDFPGYVASLEQTHRWLDELGRIPRWCPECYGGTSVFTSRLKEALASPLLWISDPVVAMKLAFAVFRWIAALGIFACFVRLFSAPFVGLATGVVYSFGGPSNHSLIHLDGALAAALVPPFLLAAVETLRGQSRTAPIALGALGAAIFSNSWVRALIALALAGLLLWLRPWGGSGLTTRGRWRRVALASVVAMLLSASCLAWLLADASHHRLIAPEVAARTRPNLSLPTPLLFLNRDGVLAKWLMADGSRRQSLRLASGSRYLGIAAIAIAIGGWFRTRRHRVERRWYQLAIVLFLFQLNLAMGPRVALQQLGWSPASEPALQLAVLVAALALGVAAFLGSRRTGSRGWIEAATALSILGVALCVPLYEGLTALLPPLRAHRSPGQFASLIHFPITFLFGLGMLALCRVPKRRAVRALVGACLLGVVLIDFAPSFRSYSQGRALAPLRAAGKMIEGLENEEGTLRILARSDALSSYLIENTGLGFASGWLPWQAGSEWSRYLAMARRDVGSTGRGTLLGLGRIRYFLHTGSKQLPAPWTLRERSGAFQIWEQPEIHPYAAFYPAPGDRAHFATERRDAPGSAGPPDWVGEVDSAEAVAWTRPTPEQIVATLPADAPAGWLFLSESYHPWWRAEVDGEEAELILARPAFMAVRLGPDAREVSISFEPPLLVAAADRVSALGWVLVLLLGLASIGTAIRASGASRTE